MSEVNRTRLHPRLLPVAALASPRLTWILPLVVFALLSPGLDEGWLVDDHMHRAALLYSIDDSQTLPVLWIANRNAVLGGVFGVMTLWLYDRWRRDGWTPGAVLAPASLVVAVLANEGAVAVGAYLVAYALFLDPAPPRRRWLALVPSALTGLAWLVFYRVAGYGASGSGIYLDPGAHPLRYLGALTERLPVLFWGQWAFPSADLYILLSENGQRVAVGLALALLVLLTAVLLPILRERPEARFFALGMMASLIPAASPFPSNRMLVFAGIGAAGLLALLLKELVRRRRHGPRVRRLVSGGGLAILVLIHLVLPPLAIFPYLGMMGDLEELIRKTAASVPDDPAIENQDAVIVSTPSGFVSLGAMVVRALGESPAPKRTLVLASSLGPSEVERADATTLIVRPRAGFLPAPARIGDTVLDRRRVFAVLDLLFRDVEGSPFAAGDTVDLGDPWIEVLEVEAGRPLAIAVRFSEPLESRRFRWLRWEGGGYVSYVPPPAPRTNP